MMKEVMAFIRANKINRTKEALWEAGFPSLTCRYVLGRGKRKVDFTIADYPPDVAKRAPDVAEALSEGRRLVPKRFLTLVVQDDEVKRVIDTLMQTNSTGNPGDGKIFVLPITDVYRIRTAEAGGDAV
jgi:nitrogen regulatory protein PII 2